VSGFGDRGSNSQLWCLRRAPLFVEDYYLLGKRETIERADVEAIVGFIKSDNFTALVKEIPGYGTSNTAEVTNVTDVIG
jgi:putative molybdopterin biosynthesis protein